MIEVLGDFVVFDKSPDGKWQAVYFEEVPIELFHTRYLDKPRLTWVFKYDEEFSGPNVLDVTYGGSKSARSAERSNFLHPHLSYYAATERSRSMGHWIPEDVFDSWRSPEVGVPLWRFVARVIGHATDQADLWTEAIQQQHDYRADEAAALSGQLQDSGCLPDDVEGNLLFVEPCASDPNNSEAMSG